MSPQYVLTKLIFCVKITEIQSTIQGLEHMPVSPLSQELEDEYDKARPILKDALRAANWVATPDSTYADYLEALLGDGENGISLCHCYMVQ
jgi:hypothetical protein